MKRIGNLYAKVISLDNLRLADERARRGKTRTYGVRHHDENREKNLIDLHVALATKTYRTSEYNVFKVYKPKERDIYRLPYYPDRIVHHAIMNVVEPIWHKTFTRNTFSCIKGRGIEGCARYVRKIIRKYEGRPLYCLKIDIRKFYPSIDHEIMKQIVRRRIKDRDLLWLIDEIIDSTDGLPIGNYLSQHLANLYLCYLMHYVNEVLRVDAAEYADDIVFFADNKTRLHGVLKQVKMYLSKNLKLQLKSNWQIFPISMNRYDRHGRALDYVGYKFFRHQQLLRKSIKQNMARQAAKLNRQDIDIKQYKQCIAPWLGWCIHSNSINFLQTIINKDYEDILRHNALDIRGSRKRQLAVSLRHERSACTYNG